MFGRQKNNHEGTMMSTNPVEEQSPWDNLSGKVPFKGEDPRSEQQPSEKQPSEIYLKYFSGDNQKRIGELNEAEATAEYYDLALDLSRDFNSYRESDPDYNVKVVDMILEDTVLWQDATTRQRENSTNEEYRKTTEGSDILLAYGRRSSMNRQLAREYGMEESSLTGSLEDCFWQQVLQQSAVEKRFFGLGDRVGEFDDYFQHNEVKRALELRRRIQSEGWDVKSSSDPSESLPHVGKDNLSIESLTRQGLVAPAADGLILGRADLKSE